MKKKKTDIALNGTRYRAMGIKFGYFCVVLLAFGSEIVGAGASGGLTDQVTWQSLWNTVWSTVWKLYHANTGDTQRSASSEISASTTSIDNLQPTILNMNSSAAFKTFKLCHDFKPAENLSMAMDKIRQDETLNDIEKYHKRKELYKFFGQKFCEDLMAANLPETYNQEKLRDVMVRAARKNEVNPHTASDRKPVGNKTPALGSSDMVTFPGHDAGFLSTVVEAYNRHYNLRTGPEDWWYCIIQTVALAIDKNSKKDEVRKFFVQHEGKKKLTVYVSNVLTVDYTWFFEQMSKQIAKNINVPDYVDKMKTDFSQSTKIHKIVSEITLMSSMQEYFSYGMRALCGIPAVEMKGTQEDWERLGMKIAELKQTLKPIHDAIGLTYWWKRVENIANKLLDTYNGNPDKEWWSQIIRKRSKMCGDPAINGWFMTSLLNVHTANSISDAPSGLVSVPMTIDDNGHVEDSAIVAGMIGYKLHVDNASIPTVEAIHGWSLLLEPGSVLMNKMSD